MIVEAETAEEAQAEVVAGANALLLDEFRPASLATFAALLRAQAEAQAGRQRCRGRRRDKPTATGGTCKMLKTFADRLAKTAKGFDQTFQNAADGKTNFDWEAHLRALDEIDDSYRH